MSGVTANPVDVTPIHLAQALRHECIAEIVLREDFVSLKDLAARLDVSLMTVHRDLDELERQGVLRKVRGERPRNLRASSRATCGTA